MNLTLSLDDAVVKQARIRAIEEGTSVSAKIREMITIYAKHGSYRSEGSAEMREAWARVMGWQLGSERAPAEKTAPAGLRAETYAGDFRSAARTAAKHG